MKIRRLRLINTRCFEDTGDLNLGGACNIFVGQNNIGKSTILKSLLNIQGIGFSEADARFGTTGTSSTVLFLESVKPRDNPERLPGFQKDTNFRVIYTLRGNNPPYDDRVQTVSLSSGKGVFQNSRPHHKIIPFLARRKAAVFDHNVALGAHNQLSGTLSNLYARIDLLAVTGHPLNESFSNAVVEAVGLKITTRPSAQGKEAGFYFDESNFVSLDRMGDGVSEMVALIVELCIEKDKIFVLDEPESSLHPRGLKALLALIRTSAAHNQFFISTHSNIVLRELGGMDDSKIFRVRRDGPEPSGISSIAEVQNSTSDHIELLRELGYEFSDLNLHDGWLFLEESSAESVIQNVLIPNFAPDLRGRLRTYAAGGDGNLEASVSEFSRLVVFVRLQPVYAGRLWIRADAGKSGMEAIEKIRRKFPTLESEYLAMFGKENFEEYYPDLFRDDASKACSETNKQKRRQMKKDLLLKVLEWSKTNSEEARSAWLASAEEPIELLRSIGEKLRS